MIKTLKSKYSEDDFNTPNFFAKDEDFFLKTSPDTFLASKEPDFIKSFKQFYDAEWRIFSQISANIDGTLISLLFQKKECSLIILWQTRDDYIFCIDTDLNQYIHSNLGFNYDHLTINSTENLLIAIKDIQWDVNISNLLAISVTAQQLQHHPLDKRKNTQEPEEHYYVLVFVINAQSLTYKLLEMDLINNIVSTAEQNESSTNPHQHSLQLLKLNFPIYITSTKEFSESNLMRRVGSYDSYSGIAKAHTFTIIQLDNISLLQQLQPLSPPFEEMNYVKSETLFTFNNNIDDDSQIIPKNDYDWEKVYEGILTLLNEEWEKFYDWHQSCSENSFYGHLAKVCLHRNQLDLALVCLRRYWSSARYQNCMAHLQKHCKEFTASATTNNIVLTTTTTSSEYSSITPISYRIDEERLLKIAILFAYLGAKQNSMNILREIVIETRNMYMCNLYVTWCDDFSQKSRLDFFHNTDYDDEGNDASIISPPSSSIIIQNMEDVNKIVTPTLSGTIRNILIYDFVFPTLPDNSFIKYLISIVGSTGSGLNNGLKNRAECSGPADKLIRFLFQFTLKQHGFKNDNRQCLRDFTNFLRLTFRYFSGEKGKMGLPKDIVANVLQNLSITTTIEALPTNSNDNIKATQSRSGDDGLKILYEWLANYAESKGLYSESLDYYGAIQDVFSIVKMYCKIGRLDKAVSLAQKHENKATFFYLGQRYESKGDILSAIKFFTFADAFSVAFKLCKVYHLERELFELAQGFPKSHKLEIAKFLEKKTLFLNEAESLYKSLGDPNKTLELAVRTENLTTLNEIINEMTPRQLEKCERVDEICDVFVKNRLKERAISILFKASMFDRAINLTITSLPSHANKLAEQFLMIVNSDLNKKGTFLSLNNETKCFSSLAQACLDTGNFQTACQIYNNILNDKTEAMRCLIKSGNVEQIITFSKLACGKSSVAPEINVMAANYLQTIEYSKMSPQIFKAIVENYVRAKAYAQLVNFFESFAQEKIDRNDYGQALALLTQAQKYVIKIDPYQTLLITSTDSNDTREHYERRLKGETEALRRYLMAQKCLADKDPDMVRHCEELLDIHVMNDKLDSTESYKVLVPESQIMSLLLRFYLDTNDLPQAKNMFDKLKNHCHMNNLQLKDTILEDLKNLPTEWN